MSVFRPGVRVVYSSRQEEAFYGKWGTVITDVEFARVRGHDPVDNRLVNVRFDEETYGNCVWTCEPDSITPAFDSIAKIEEFLQ